jgi:hypothetical protein
MVVANALDEYLAEIREQVCSRCVERPPGGPPCEPLGKVCGVEMHLPALIGAIHDINSPWIQRYREHNREIICEKCAFYHASVCPCPMDGLIFLVVKAVDTVDERHPEAAVQAGEGVLKALPPDVEEIVRLYEQTTGRWTGCDWPTSFGKGRLDLNGVTAAEAEAEVAARPEAVGDWREAVRWLARVERSAHEAEREAREAVAFARAAAWENAVRQAEREDGEAVAFARAAAWENAVRHAERAWELEFTTGRPLWRRPSHTWRTLNQAIQMAARAREPGVVLSSH